MVKSGIKRRSFSKCKSLGIFDWVLIFLIAILTIITLYPIMNVLSNSFSSLEHIIKQDIKFFPKDLSIESYKLLFSTNDIWVAYKNTIIYTLLGTSISLLVTVPVAYACSQKRFHFRRVVLWLIMFTMFFGGGMIPMYILIDALNMFNTPWAIVLPHAVVPSYVILARTYFYTIPASLFESADLDGANELKKLWFIGIPTAKPIIAVLALYLIVNYWNTYYTCMLYLDDIKLHPLQSYLQKILSSSVQSDFGGGGNSSALQIEQLKYSAIVVAMFPIMSIYPFLQKYFVKGIMVGSIKE